MMDKTKIQSQLNKQKNYLKNITTKTGKLKQH